MDIRLGTRFYEVAVSGLVTPRVVLELPFKLSDAQFLDTEEAIADAISKGRKALKTTDSIYQHKVIEERIKELGNRRSTKQILETLPVFYEHWTIIGTDKTVVDVDAISKPGTYFLPGTKVWIAITPATHYFMSPSWRPEVYFVLKTTVQEVTYRNRRLNYNFLGKTDYHPSSKDVFGSADDAKEALCQLINLQVPALADVKRVHVYSDKQETEWSQARYKELEARHTRVAAE